MSSRPGGRERVLDLADRELDALDPAHAERLGQGPVPDAADELGARVLLARRADERAVAHLRERGAQVVDVRGLVGADVGDEPRRLTVAGDEVGSASTVLGPGERVERGDLDEQQPGHALDQRLEVEVDVVGQQPVGHRPPSPAHRVDRRPPPPGGRRCPCARAWCCVSSSVTGFSKAMSRAANHICLWPPSSS